MAGNLKTRLSRLRSAARSGRENEEGGGIGFGDSASAPVPPCLASWERKNGYCYERSLRRPCPLPPRLDARPFLSKRRTGPRLEGAEALETGRLRFFDLETTGLSGGAGTIAFLAAVGRIEAGELVLRQFFLSDYPGEAPFLEALLAEFPADAVLGSYNGLAFDLPLLRTRCVLNGLSPPDLPHLDLLYPARRLWRRIHGGASLGLLEVAVLGRDRGEDLPGSRIPGIYFDFLKGGAAEELGLVFSHNAEDVLSLALLCGLIDDVFFSPLEAGAAGGLDRRGLGLSLLNLGREGEGEALLEAAAAAGDEAAAFLLSRRYARAGRRTERAAILDRLGSSLSAEIERAKYFEHAARDYGSALACVDRAEIGLGLAGGLPGGHGPAEALRAALALRRARLEKKLARR